MKHLRAIVMIISVCMSSIAIAQEKPLITVGYYEFPPATYTDSSGNPAGSGVELCRTLLHNANYEVEFKALPSARLYAQLISGDVDLWLGAANKPELIGYTLESTRIIGEITLALFYHPDTKPPQLPEGLQGKKIILISGYNYWPPVSQWLTDSSLNLTLTRTRQHASAIEMLMRKRGDYLLDYLEPMRDTLQRLGLKRQHMPYIKIHTAPLSFIVSKRADNAERLLADLELQFDRYNTTRLLQDQQ